MVLDEGKGRDNGREPSSPKRTHDELDEPRLLILDRAPRRSRANVNYADSKLIGRARMNDLILAELEQAELKSANSVGGWLGLDLLAIAQACNRCHLTHRLAPE